jgi:hypothetical protein
LAAQSALNHAPLARYRSRGVLFEEASMPDRTIISARTLKSITRIDSGNTLLIEFDDAGGETVSILVPAEEVATLSEKLAEAMMVPERNG